MTFARNSLRRWPWLPIALIGFYLPWVWHPSAALTANAYDLAEWTSIHPAVRGGSIPLLVPFLLRFVLSGLALLCGLRALTGTSQYSQRWITWLYGAFALILALTLLPPPEFFRGAGDDPNYRQQFILALGTTLILLAMFGARWWLSCRARLLAMLTIVVGATTLLAGVIGDVMGLTVMRAVGIVDTPGGGIVVVFAGLAPLLLAQIGKIRAVQEATHG